MVGIVAAVVVGVAFLVAGGSKLAAGPQWPAMATEMRTPAWVIPWVPWLELAVGAALVAQLADPWAAGAAAGLLVAFSAAIVARLRAGETPRCACFGAWSAEPIGPKHLLRNAALLALAMVAVVW